MAGATGCSGCAAPSANPVSHRLGRALAAGCRREGSRPPCVCVLMEPIQLWLIKSVCACGAQANPDNRLLQVRGNACTHDVALGSETLRALVAAAADEEGPGAGAAKGDGAGVAVPRYDKAAHGGRGDRAPRDAWPRVRGPVDLVRSSSGGKSACCQTHLLVLSILRLARTADVKVAAVDTRPNVCATSEGVRGGRRNIASTCVPQVRGAEDCDSTRMNCAVCERLLTPALCTSISLCPDGPVGTLPCTGQHPGQGSL
jgi:hypothetical protein